MRTAKKNSTRAKMPIQRIGLKAYQYVDRLVLKAVKQLLKLAHAFPRTDFLSCDDLPYPGHQRIFEDTYRKLVKATEGHAAVTQFGVVTYGHGYMAMNCELSDDVSAAIEGKVDAILRAGERLSGEACTICGEKVANLDHLKSPEPRHGFCKAHGQDEIDAVFEARVDLGAVAEELGIELAG
jgi:hypothetical protein